MHQRQFLSHLSRGCRAKREEGNILGNRCRENGSSFVIAAINHIVEKDEKCILHFVQFLDSQKKKKIIICIIKIR